MNSNFIKNVKKNKIFLLSYKISMKKEHLHMHCANSVMLIRFEGFNWLPQKCSYIERIHYRWLRVFAGKVESDRIAREGFNNLVTGIGDQNRRGEGRVILIQRECCFGVSCVSLLPFSSDEILRVWRFYRIGRVQVFD